MPERYRVCIIQPPGNPHAACFREVAMLIGSAVKSNNIDCDFTINQPARDRVNIILGYHLMTFEPGLKNYRYIPYQLEQLHSDEFPFNKNMEQVLTHATDVWDYSPKNIQFLKQRGIRAKHIVPGYQRNLELIPYSRTQNIDVLFYGSILDRRRNILEPLSQYCKVKILRGVYGEKRDKWVSRSKLVINIHHYSTQIFEAVRISYLLNNRIFVVTEESQDDSYPLVDIPRVPYGQLVDTCVDFLNRPDDIDELRRRCAEQFRTHYPMDKMISNLIKPAKEEDTPDDSR